VLYSISFEDVRERFQNHLREENSVLSVVNPIKK